MTAQCLSFGRAFSPQPPWRSPPRPRAPKRSRRRWSRPTTTIRRSWPSAPICAPSTKACRRRWPAGGRPCSSPARWAKSSSRTRPPAPPTVPAHATFQPKTVDVNISQPIYQGGQTVAKTAAAEQTVKAERARYAATESLDPVRRLPGLFRRAARPGGGRAQHQQRAGAAPPARGHQRPVPRRLGDAHRRGAGRGAARRGDGRAGSRPRATSRSSRVELRALRRPSARGPDAARASSGDPGDARRGARACRDQEPERDRRALHRGCGALDGGRDAGAASAEPQPRRRRQPRDRRPSSNGRETTTGSVVLRVTMPLYEGGQIYSQTRQAQEKVAQSTASPTTRGARRCSPRPRRGRRCSRRAPAPIRCNRRSAPTQIALEGVRQEQQVGVAHHARRAQSAAGTVHRPGVSWSRRSTISSVAEFNLAQQIGTLDRGQSGVAGQALRRRSALQVGARQVARIRRQGLNSIAPSGWPFRTASPSLCGEASPVACHGGCQRPARTVDGGDTRLHPAHHCRGRRDRRTATRARPRPERRRKAAEDEDVLELTEVVEEDKPVANSPEAPRHRPRRGAALHDRSRGAAARARADAAGSPDLGRRARRRRSPR